MPKQIRSRGPTIYTFGYEGLALDAFIGRLEQAGVRTVADVRQLAFSRKRGFSKGPLSAALQEAGLAYVHLPDLGGPPEIRKRYRADGDWPAYAAAYRAHLAGQKRPLAELARIVEESPTCLVCFEADFRLCHRSILARALTRSGAGRIVHLSAEGQVVETGQRATARRGA